MTLTPTESAGKFILICPRTVEGKTLRHLFPGTWCFILLFLCPQGCLVPALSPISHLICLPHWGLGGVGEEKPLHSSYHLQSRGEPLPLDDGKGEEGIWNSWA